MSDTLKLAETLIETPETEIIKAGGPSNSALLNNLRGRAINDLVTLDRRTASTSGSIAMARTVFATQLTALTSQYQALAALLPNTPGTSWIVDFHVSSFVDEEGTTAEVDTTYGQVTLPITSRQEKLVGEDTRGNLWVPKTTQLYYSYSSSAPGENDWLTDSNSLHCLDGRSDTAWWRTRATSGAVWVRAKLPLNLNSNRMSNAVVIHPFPALHYHLESVEYRDPAGNWVSLDLSYIEGWDSDDNRVNACGNVRLIFPQAQVTEIRLKLTVPAGPWGLIQLGVQHLEFSSTGTLTADFTSYSTGVLRSSVLLGKDMDLLNALTRSINGPKVLVSLTQNSAGSTPVITGVEVFKA